MDGDFGFSLLGWEMSVGDVKKFQHEVVICLR